MDDIDQMKAGEVLDRLIAEEVMGWKRNISHVSGRKFYYTQPTGKSRYIQADGKKFVPSRDWFNPSRDIAAAWEVVGKLEADGFRYLLWSDSTGHSARFYPRGSDMWEATCEALPRAICIAALRAVRATAPAQPEKTK